MCCLFQTVEGLPCSGYQHLCQIVGWISKLLNCLYWESRESYPHFRIIFWVKQFLINWWTNKVLSQTCKTCWMLKTQPCGPWKMKMGHTSCRMVSKYHRYGLIKWSWHLTSRTGTHLWLPKLLKTNLMDQERLLILKKTNVFKWLMSWQLPVSKFSGSSSNSAELRRGWRRAWNKFRIKIWLNKKSLEIMPVCCGTLRHWPAQT